MLLLVLPLLLLPLHAKDIISEIRCGVVGGDVAADSAACMYSTIRLLVVLLKAVVVVMLWEIVGG